MNSGNDSKTIAFYKRIASWLSKTQYEGKPLMSLVNKNLDRGLSDEQNYNVIIELMLEGKIPENKEFAQEPQMQISLCVLASYGE